LWKPCAAWKVGPADRRVTHCDEFVRQLPGWQGERLEDADGEAAVMKNPSVVLVAANWAWLRGAREILLVGVDYRGGHPRMIEPYARAAVGWAGQYERPVPARIEAAFRQAVAAVEALGGRLVNVSPGTRLRAAPRECWHEGRHRL